MIRLQPPLSLDVEIHNEPCPEIGAAGPMCRAGLRILADTP
jgi:hypothetical protein